MVNLTSSHSLKNLPFAIFSIFCLNASFFPLLLICFCCSDDDMMIQKRIRFFGMTVIFARQALRHAACYSITQTDEQKVSLINDTTPTKRDYIIFKNLFIVLNLQRNCCFVSLCVKIISVLWHGLMMMMMIVVVLTTTRKDLCTCTQRSQRFPLCVF